MPEHTLIIGASSGIGLECAKLLKEKGSVITNISRTPSAAADINVLLDVTSDVFPEALRNLLSATPEIDTIVYSAGFSMAAPVEYADMRDARYLFEVNFFRFAECARTAMPFLRERKGTLVVVSSVGAIVPIAYDAYYSASKAAVNMFVRELVSEAAPYGVKVLAVMPGGTSTDFTFKRKIYNYSETGVYGEAMKSAVNTLALIEQGGMTPESVAETVISSIEDAQEGCLMSSVLASGLPNKAIAVTAKLLPKRVTDAIATKIYMLRDKKTKRV